MAVACPWGIKACAGGPLHGNASCVTGHHGNFCAECWQGWFRGTSSCRKCPQDTSHAAAVAVSMVVVTGIGVLIAAAYLRTAATTATGSHVFLGGCCPPLARLLARLPPSTPRQVSAVFKIVVGLVQCLSTLRSFSRVLWPEVFTDFIVTIDQFTVEVS